MRLSGLQANQEAVEKPRHESFLVRSDFRYLKVSVLLVVAATAAYLWHDPGQPASGGTWLGYTLGTIGALIIFWLMLFGVRKRKYHSSMGTLVGWLSAHVYLGAALLVIATLHAAFQFGWNLHTLAYVLMVLVILSGMYGVYTYVRYPRLLTDNRTGMVQDAMLVELAEIDNECLILAAEYGGEPQKIVEQMVEHAVVGGSTLRQLTATRHNPVDAVEDRLAKASSVTDARARALRALIGRRKRVVDRINADIQFHAVMKFWLYLHVPLSFALLGALLAHIVSVFYYW